MSDENKKKTVGKLERVTYISIIVLSLFLMAEKFPIFFSSDSQIFIDPVTNCCGVSLILLTVIIWLARSEKYI